MTKMNINKALSLASFLKKSDFVSKLFARAIQIWDINYVRQSIMGSIKESTFMVRKDKSETIRFNRIPSV